MGFYLVSAILAGAPAVQTVGSGRLSSIKFIQLDKKTWLNANAT